MNIYKWILVILLALSVLTTVVNVGKPRPDTTAGIAAATVVLGGIMILLVVNA